MRVFKEIDNGQDLKNWADNDSWGCEYTIARIDALDCWQEVFEYIDFEQDISELHLNDILRFEIDAFLDEFLDELEDDEDTI